MLIEDTDGYTIGRRDKERVKTTHSLLIDDLKIYQESHLKLEVVIEIIVKASMGYGVKKCAEIVLRKGKMIKGERLAVFKEKMDALDPNKNEIYKFIGCEKADKIDVK